MQVPLLDLAAQHEPIRDEIMAKISEIMDSNRYIMGPEIEALEESVAEYSQCKRAIGVSSGSDALIVALMALGIGHGDEVITTTYSFFATAGAIARLGAVPVLVDIDPVSYNLDVSQIEDKINDKTKAIIPVHLYGQMADMTSIMDIANKYGLAVIEDAAQAIGSEDAQGRRAGSVGTCGCFSFFPSKNMGALGDGGMVVTNDEALADTIFQMRNHGMNPKYYHKIIGGNFRLDAIHAAVLRIKLRHLDSWSAGRQANAEEYYRLFEEAGLDQVKLPKAIYKDSGSAHYHIYNQFIIEVEDREALRSFLNESKIGNEVYYPLSFHQQECFAYLGYQEGDFPKAEHASNKTLALPIYPELTNDMQAYVVSKIAEFYA